MITFGWHNYRLFLYILFLFLEANIGIQEYLNVPH